MLPVGWRVTLGQGGLSPLLLAWPCPEVRACLRTPGMAPASWGSCHLYQQQLLRAGCVQAGLSCPHTPPSPSWGSHAHGLMTPCQPQKPLCAMPQALGMYPAPAALALLLQPLHP